MDIDIRGKEVEPPAEKSCLNPGIGFYLASAAQGRVAEAEITVPGLDTELPLWAIQS